LCVLAASQSPSLSCSQLASQLLQQHRQSEPTAAKSHERRKTGRKNFVCWQLVAEYDGVALPGQPDFHLHLFQDISTGGVSFLSDRKPRTQELIVALGAIPFVFFHVRQVRAIRLKNREGYPFLIGCRFVKRLLG